MLNRICCSKEGKFQNTDFANIIKSCILTPLVAITYLLLLLALFFIEAGKCASVDYWVAKKFS